MAWGPETIQGVLRLGQEDQREPAVMEAAKTILVVYHSQGGIMEKLARGFVRGAAREQGITVQLKRAADARLEDLLGCSAIAIGSPEYFGTMAGMIKDFFDRTYEGARQRTVGLPYVVFVCAGNDGRGALMQIERIASGYSWKKALEHVRITGSPAEKDLAVVEELGQTLAAGIDFGIF
ncbi:MAG TPA: NAD(P)H-dependent oxidoreductase [Desulfopila sp.]|nr:NAD(P)H-dependent oxidoreductase [Desulfopila sp.]